MTLPFNLPDWLPWWVPLVLLVPTLLWGLAFLLVPFSVIGVKARLDGLEARLDEIHAEIRTLSLRLPELVRAVEFDEVYTTPEHVGLPRRTPVTTRPPIPPPAHEMEMRERGAPPPSSIPRGARRPDRTEPRLDWPHNT